MALKKIDIDFVLSDSSVNVYGFRLSTAGYLMDEFLKNPIGYYGHDKGDGVLLKWDELRLDGDKILGKPVMNMEHPRALRTIEEIENGFLNAASVGSIVVLEHHLEDNGTGIVDRVVADKWYNKECSLVDSPGNREAFKVELFDKDDKVINLSDLRKVSIPITHKKSRNSMKKVTLPMSPELISLLNLGDEEITEANVTQAIQDLHDNNAALTAEITQVKKKAGTDAIKAILDKGLSDGKFNAATRTQLAKDYATNPIGLKTLVDAMPVYNGIVDTLQETPKGLKDLMDKDWDTLDKSGKLGALKSGAPDLYREKFFDKFGKYPKGME